MGDLDVYVSLLLIYRVSVNISRHFRPEICRSATQVISLLKNTALPSGLRAPGKRRDDKHVPVNATSSDIRDLSEDRP